MMNKRLICWLFCMLTVFLPGIAAAGETVSAPSLAELQQGRESVEKAEGLADDQRARLLEMYDQSLVRHRELEAVREQFAALREELVSAPVRLEQLREGESARVEVMLAEELEALSLDALEAKVVERERRLNEARERLRRAEDGLSRLLGGAAALNEVISSRSGSLDQLERELASLPQASSEPALQARLHNLLVRKALRQTELEFHQSLIANQGMLTNLAQAERDRANAIIAALQVDVDALKMMAQQRREALARAAREEADRLRATAATLPPDVERLAALNTALRAELERVVRDEQGINQRLQLAARELDEMRADFERIRQRVEVVGRSVAIGNTLRSRRAALPSPADYRRDRLVRGDEISAATHRQLEIDDDLRAFGQREQTIRAAVATRSASLGDEARAALEADADTVLAAYRESLNALQQTWGRYINRLTSLDVAERDLVLLAETYIGYIDEQLLWMPSTGLFTLVSTDRALWQLWLTDRDNWASFNAHARDFVERNPMVAPLVLVVLVVLLLAKRGSTARLQTLNESVRKIRFDSVGLTARALGIHVLRVLPLPFALLVAAAIMERFGDAIATALAHGLSKAALLVISLGLLREMARKVGVGEHHFGWPPEVCAGLRRELAWFIPVGALLSLCVGMLGTAETPPLAQAFGSAAFVALMLMLVVLLRRLFGERSATRAVLRDRFAGSWPNQLHFLWYPAMLLVPLVLAVISMGGYHYTAVHLEERVQMTLWFLFGLFVLMELILRWLFVAERRLRYEDALRRRDELRAQRAAEGDEGGDEGGAPIVPEVPEVNFDSLGEQSKRLVRAGFLFAVLFGTWSIWANLIPALGFLDGAQLPFEANRVVDGVSTAMPITAGDILFGLFLVVVTILAAKNIPGILEISLLQRLPLDPGARYAITALTQYTIAGIGLLIAFRTMGVQWGGLQWLIAALGVGLGFGLQEIVANFVSGIILLFERPIRVGDVVTIDGTTGVVTRIRIRATTITNYDKQELVVPNKTFITGQLINWTLSDKMNRILLPVGLAYGGDVDKALELMRESAIEIPEILDDPAPVASFEAFGDDALMLYLRAYLPNMDNRLSVITALHKSINAKFNAAGLVIAFPQRDVHLDVTHPLDIRLHRGQPGKG